VFPIIQGNSVFVKGEKEFNLTGKSVCIAIPCYSGIIPIETAIALASIAVELNRIGVRLDIVSERENGIITSVRNRLVYRFLKESDAEYLFWLDDDIIFQVQDFLTIFALATEKGIVAATYPSRKEPSNFFIKYTEGTKPEFEPDYGLIKAKGLGLGFLCMDRKIVQQVFDDNADSEYDDSGFTPRDLFKIGVRNRKYWGEDMSFLVDLYDTYGHISYVHPWINLKHVGRKDYDAKLMETFKEN
jgi:hypothetical protein